MGWFNYGRHFPKLITEKCFMSQERTYPCCVPWKHLPLTRASHGSESGYSTPFNSRETVSNYGWGSGSEDTDSKRHTVHRWQRQSQDPRLLLQIRALETTMTQWSIGSLKKNLTEKLFSEVGEKMTPRWLWAEGPSLLRRHEVKVLYPRSRGECTPSPSVTS